MKNDIRDEKKLHIPRIMIAAAGSGSGKTLITCALLELLKQRSGSVRSYKCGPDYIDPMFHKKVLGIDSDNLDSWFGSPDQVRQLLKRGGEGVAVIEGVMGIYDGISPDGVAGSCYEIASITRTPIILIIDASGAGRTLISLIKGILNDDKEKLIRGIILNRISEGYYEKIKPVIEKEFAAEGYTYVRSIGGIPKVKDVKFDSRHLGLKLPEETAEAAVMIRSFAAVIDERCDIDMLLEIMEEAEDPGEGENDDIMSTNHSEDHPADLSGDIEYANIMLTTNILHPEPSPVLAVAYDEAFCFYYRENLRILEELGLVIEYFSPIRDKEVPGNASALLIGGGYPELHLEALSSNRTMLESVRKCVLNGMPALAECGGFMYLHKEVEDAEGRVFSLASIVDGRCSYTGRPVRFGYMQLTGDETHPCKAFGVSIDGIKGHEFHYYDSTDNGHDCIARKPSGLSWECMKAGPHTLWGFAHLYYASDPALARGFTKAAEDYLRLKAHLPHPDDITAANLI